MQPSETRLEMVRRHVRQGRGHVARQRVLIERLRGLKLPTLDAEDLLARFEASQGEHEDHLEQLLRDQEAGLRDAAGDLIQGVAPRSPQIRR